MNNHTHFVISSEPTKPNLDPTKKIALKFAQEAVAFAKQKAGEDVSSLYASAVFSTDGFYHETKEVGALGDESVGADKIKTIKDLDEVVNHWISKPDARLLSGLAMAEDIHERISGTEIDTDTIVTPEELASVSVSVIELAQRMFQLDRTKGRKWTVSAGDFLFDEQFEHFGVSWADSDAMAVAIEASPNYRLWITRLEVTTP
ncbi:hypothetical protein UFOVP357_43 [uncultured Caudovirales phage]|uniref:Uncharacterized protein n=1 Tax=uncultured Caudovirales phage TaxID=2100421 RepID=A0A6J7WSG8_9CAUD|nr:hypothetical protein UFOVP357_43 [uncultured Caudovirales phage]